jgi:phosphodiesterase/alkaline phosphatase D-like protein
VWYEVHAANASARPRHHTMHAPPPSPSRRHCIALAGALALPAFVRHARAADVPRFALGIASGQPQARSIVLWTRLTGADLPTEVPVRWELSRNEAFSDIAARGSEIALEADAHSVHAEPAALEPGRWYRYRFEALGQRSVVCRTRTAPAADATRTSATAARISAATCGARSLTRSCAAPRLAIDAQTLQASLMAVDDATKADSAVQVAARFVVDAQQPGARPG